jgi:adenosylmethionine-8-amino-7-oxononanoate aminotransferase
VIFAGMTHQGAAELAGELVRRAPERLTRVFYSDDGSTAVEVALKMAYQAWRLRGEPGRNLFVALDDAYHGDTFGAMAAGGVGAFHGTFSDLLFEVRRVATPVSQRRPEHGEDLEEVLAREGQRVAAVIVEPLVQGAGGMRMLPAEFLARVRRLTEAQGIPLIADEVFTGFGRTGTLFACEQAGVEPDLMCLSKGLTGGYLPLAVTLASEEIYQAFLSEERSHAFFHGHSFTANALACAVALESLRLFEEEDRLGRVREFETLFRHRLRELASLPLVHETRCLGAIAALDLKGESGGGYLDDLGPRLGRELLRRDLLLRPLGEVLYFLPPYIITDEEVHRVFDIVAEVLQDLSATG